MSGTYTSRNKVKKDYIHLDGHDFTLFVSYTDTVPVQLSVVISSVKPY